MAALMYSNDPRAKGGVPEVCVMCQKEIIFVPSRRDWGDYMHIALYQGRLVERISERDPIFVELPSAFWETLSCFCFNHDVALNELLAATILFEEQCERSNDPSSAEDRVRIEEFRHQLYGIYETPRDRDLQAVGQCDICNDSIPHEENPGKFEDFSEVIHYYVKNPRRGSLADSVEWGAIFSHEDYCNWDWFATVCKNHSMSLDLRSILRAVVTINKRDPADWAIGKSSKYRALLIFVRECIEFLRLTHQVISEEDDKWFDRILSDPNWAISSPELESDANLKARMLSEQRREKKNEKREEE